MIDGLAPGKRGDSVIVDDKMLHGNPLPSSQVIGELHGPLICM